MADEENCYKPNVSIIDNLIFGMSATEFSARKMAYYVDEAIFDYLKQIGYRPKQTEKYAKGLLYRLKRKGLELKVNRVVRYSEYNLDSSINITVMLEKIKEE